MGTRPRHRAGGGLSAQGYAADRRGAQGDQRRRHGDRRSEAHQEHPSAAAHEDSVGDEQFRGTARTTRRRAQPNRSDSLYDVILGQGRPCVGQAADDEQSAILNWAMDGFRQLVSQGGQFTLPDSSLELMEQLQVESAPLQSFIQDACALDPRKGVYKVSLYEGYQGMEERSRFGEPRVVDGRLQS